MARFNGVRYPITKTVKGYFAGSSDVEQIKSDMMVIILTLPGERVFEPLFGTPLHKVDTRQLPDIVERQAAIIIAKALKKWEKRVQVTDVKTKITPNKFGYFDLRIEVIFIDPIDLNQVQKLTLGTSVGQYQV